MNGFATTELGPPVGAGTSDAQGGESIHGTSNLDTHSYKEGRGGEGEED